MRYLHEDLGHQQSGAVVHVSLRGNAANVLLLDSTNLGRYQRGQRYSYHGGQVKRSPFRVFVPRSGHWHVVVDLGGYAGNVSASVQVLPA